MVVTRNAATVRRAATEVPEVKDGNHAAEINFQTLELKVCCSSPITSSGLFFALQKI